MGIIENKKAKNAFENLLSRQNYLVTQANELARAFGNLNATEHKILDYCFSYIKKEDTVDTVYHLTLQEILKHQVLVLLARTILGLLLLYKNCMIKLLYIYSFMIKMESHL